MDSQKLQTKIYVEPFSGEEKDFPKREMATEAVFELEELVDTLDMAFLLKFPNKNQVLDPENPEHMLGSGLKGRMQKRMLYLRQ